MSFLSSCLCRAKASPHSHSAAEQTPPVRSKPMPSARNTDTTTYHTWSKLLERWATLQEQAMNDIEARLKVLAAWQYLNAATFIGVAALILMELF